MLNRAALILRYKQPFVDWINATDPFPESHILSLAEVNQERIVYLVEVEDEEELGEWLARHHEELFEEELSGWYTDPKLWPRDRSLELLQAWCSFELHTVVLDVGGSALEEDDLEKQWPSQEQISSIDECELTFGIRRKVWGVISNTEAIWRHLLVAALDRDDRRTSITQLSGELGMPVSTIHAALEKPRGIGAVRGTAAGIRVLDPRRLQRLWAGRRDLMRDVTYRTRVALPIQEIEAQLPVGAIPTAFTAFVSLAGRNVVADYEQVVVYADAQEMKRRFGLRRGEPNLICLEPDPLLPKYGPVAPRPQVYADLFNLPSWQAQRFLEVLDREWLDHAA